MTNIAWQTPNFRMKQNDPDVLYCRGCGEGVPTKFTEEEKKWFSPTARVPRAEEKRRFTIIRQKILAAMHDHVDRCDRLRAVMRPH